MDKRVTAIRADKLVGRGSLTSIDECMGDDELIAVLDEDGATTPEAAVKWAIWSEGLHVEMALNCREGNDDDPQLVAYNEWRAKVKAHKISV
jgi:hypothetical protein